jgi:sugar phosphate isomerase/epimerase
MMDKLKDDLSRRAFLAGMGGAGVLTGLPGVRAAALAEDKASRHNPVCIFSKHLQFLDWEEMAKTAADLGFDGVDLTVRKGGHVQPERVKEDLPKVVEIVRKAGLEVPMITAEIADAHSPYAEDMLRTASALGIHHYRWGWFYWTDLPASERTEEGRGLFLPGGKTLVDRLAELKTRVKGLEELNKKYDMCAMYHNHHGSSVGCSIWDLWLIIKDSDPKWISSNLDIAQAALEGGVGGWINYVRLMGEFGYIRGTSIKDCIWAKDAKGRWEPQFCPLGQGMTHFNSYFTLLKEAKFSGPIQLQFEYPLGGADVGRRTLTIDKSQVLSAMRRDLETLRRMLKDAQLA